VGARFSAPIQTSPEVHPASFTLGNGSFSQVHSCWGVVLTNHPHVVPRLKKEYSYTSAPPLDLYYYLYPYFYKCVVCDVAYTPTTDVTVSYSKQKLHILIWICVFPCEIYSFWNHFCENHKLSNFQLHKNHNQIPNAQFMDNTSRNYTFPYLKGTLRLHQHSFNGCNNKVSKSNALQYTRQSQILDAVFILSTRVQY